MTADARERHRAHLVALRCQAVALTDSLDAALLALDAEMPEALRASLPATFDDPQTVGAPR